MLLCYGHPLGVVKQALNYNAYLLVESNDSSVIWLHFNCNPSNSVKGGGGAAGAPSAAMMMLFFKRLSTWKIVSSVDVSHKKIGSGGGNYTLQQLPQQQAEPAAEPRPNSAFFCVPTSSLFRGRRRTMYKKRSRGSEESLKTEERLKLTFSRHAGLSRARFVHGTGYAPSCFNGFRRVCMVVAEVAP